MLLMAKWHEPLMILNAASLFYSVVKPPAGSSSFRRLYFVSNAQKKHT